MPCTCIHLITAKTKVIIQGKEIPASSFLCKLKRENREIAKEINQAYQRQTQVSVAGYTCYYQHNKDVKCEDCLKFEEKK